MIEWITDIIESLGYTGIGLLMFLENLFPPIPSEVIMPLAGFTVAQGQMSLIPAIVAGSIGTFIGILPWYYAGKYLGEKHLRRLVKRYGKWITISEADFDRANHWLNQYGRQTVFWGRLIPGIRTVISLPAGIGEMPFLPFSLYSILGTVFWVTLLTVAGYLLGNNYYLVEEYLGPIAKIVLVTLAIALIVWIVRRKSK
jgi:membrane protein DedA with SNARE-associated domain